MTVSAAGPGRSVQLLPFPTMVRTLERGDTAAALRLLRLRPVHNVFLEHVVRAGGLGALPGFFGHFSGGALRGILFVGPNGGTALAATEAEAFEALAEAASVARPRPRHIVGPEDVTVPFWQAYAPCAPRTIWQRREPVYVVERVDEQAIGGTGFLVPALESDLDDLVENSARQYREDLGEDRYAAEPDAFRARHLADIGQRRWWILREEKRVVFQVHVGPENDRVVQIGGVFTVPDLRNRGLARRGVAAIVSRLLRHRPAVSLFCDEHNLAAREVYERVGFRERFHYRSWLLEAG